MRISDWSSDVCSSDLPRRHLSRPERKCGAGSGRAGRKGGGLGSSQFMDRLHPPVTAHREAGGDARDAGQAREDVAVERAVVVDPGDLDAQDIVAVAGHQIPFLDLDRKSTSELQSLMRISYAVFCLKKKNNQ